MVCGKSGLLWRGGFDLKVQLTIAAAIVVAWLSIVAYQRIVWWPNVTEWHREYFWQRCGFCLLSAVDVPVTQTFLVGLAAFAATRGGPAGT